MFNAIEQFQSLVSMYQNYDREYLGTIFLCLSELLEDSQIDKLDEILTTSGFETMKNTALDMIAGDF
jgi:hypothetical protein